VVEDHVQNDTDVALLGLGYEAVEVCHGAVLGIDGCVVGDVVAEVDLGRREHGREPDGIYSQSLQIVQTPGDAVQVSEAVAVRVLEAAGVDLVDYGVLPPGAVDGRVGVPGHRRCLGGEAGGYDAGC